jgi:hypothetical protein
MPTKTRTPLAQRTLRPSRCRPTLRFTPTAWAKLLYLRDCGDTEIGGFGITVPNRLLLVEDVVLVRQATSVASVEFDDLAVAEFFEDQVDAGRKPEEFARIWIHTHPGTSATPSNVDEDTFERVFGRCDWAVMVILARGGQTSARLQWNVGPGGAVRLPVDVDFSRGFPASDHGAWQREHAACVQPVLGPLDWDSPREAPFGQTSSTKGGLPEWEPAKN